MADWEKDEIRREVESKKTRSEQNDKTKNGDG